jgi:hypothetical protein
LQASIGVTQNTNTAIQLDPVVPRRVERLEQLEPVLSMAIDRQICSHPVVGVFLYGIHSRSKIRSSLTRFEKTSIRW